MSMYLGVFSVLTRKLSDGQQHRLLGVCRRGLGQIPLKDDPIVSSSVFFNAFSVVV